MRIQNSWLRPQLDANLPKYAWDIKGWLIFFNLAVDDLLFDVSCRRWLGYSGDGTWVGGNAVQCVLALEDRHFYRHGGIDPRFLPRLARQLLTGKRIGGISTIEQQYVRTYLNRKERTFGRKFNEWVLAWLLAHRADKQDILVSYLSCAYMGYKLTGLQAAAELVFGKDVGELDVNEASLLSSFLVYPLPKVVRKRAEGEAWFPVQDTQEFLEKISCDAPMWASKVRRRSKYALRLVGKA